MYNPLYPGISLLYNRIMIRSEEAKTRKEEELIGKFDWENFDLDKFLKDARRVGKILHKRDKVIGNDE